MKNLTIQHLAPYLPYGVQVKYNDCIYKKTHIATLSGVSNDGIETTYKRRFKGCSGDYISFKGRNNIVVLGVKPILLPLSDLTKEDISNFYGMTESEIKNIEWEEWAQELKHLIETDSPLQLKQFNYLFSRNFDLFGLIENNLAIDINTIQK